MYRTELYFSNGVINICQNFDSFEAGVYCVQIVLRYSLSQPLIIQMILRRLTVALVGLSPPVFHLTNLGLHLVVVLQLHSACVDVLGLGDAVSLLAAALFAVHPVHAEAVSLFWCFRQCNKTLCVNVHFPVSGDSPTIYQYLMGLYFDLLHLKQINPDK